MGAEKEHLHYFFSRVDPVTKWKVLGGLVAFTAASRKLERKWTLLLAALAGYFGLVKYVARLRARRSFVLPRPKGLESAGKESYPNRTGLLPLEAQLNTCLLQALEQLSESPENRDQAIWGMKGQFGRIGSIPVGPTNTAFTSIRYHIAFAAYSVGLACFSHTPAYIERTASALRKAVDGLLNHEAWGYAQVYWPKDLPFTCRENIMWHGHVLHAATLYEKITGDDRYRQPGGLKALDQHGQVVQMSDVQSLADFLAGVMDESESGGVACEPNCVFAQCQGHPQVAFRMLEALTEKPLRYRSQRDKWERFCLDNMRAPSGQPGALCVFREEAHNIQVPLAHLGSDAWTLHYHAAWTDNLERLKSLWDSYVEPIINQFDTLDHAPKPGPNMGASCCMPLGIPSSVWVPALSAAAAQLGDGKVASKLVSWTAKHLVKDGLVQEGPEWSVGSSANLLQGSILARDPSALRALTILPAQPVQWFLEQVNPSKAVEVLRATNSSNGDELELTLLAHEKCDVTFVVRQASNDQVYPHQVSLEAGAAHSYSILNGRFLAHKASL